jgi:hypothetical protein
MFDGGSVGDVGGRAGSGSNGIFQPTRHELGKSDLGWIDEPTTGSLIMQRQQFFLDLILGLSVDHVTFSLALVVVTSA